MFVNVSDYNYFLPSFQVWLPAEVTTVTLQLQRQVAPPCLTGWLFGSTDCEVWSRVVQLPGGTNVSVSSSELKDSSLQLFYIPSQLRSEDLKVFQHLLTLQADPIPVSRLEAADKTRTINLMVQQYYAEGAKEVTEEILRMMKHNQLADELQRS